jgi:hypothetical protein
MKTKTFITIIIVLSIIQVVTLIRLFKVENIITTRTNSNYKTVKYTVDETFQQEIDDGDVTYSKRYRYPRNSVGNAIKELENKFEYLEIEILNGN